MSNKINQEMNKIEIPKELSERSKMGVSKAKSELRKSKRRWSYIIGPIVAASLVLGFFASQIFTNNSSQNPVVREEASYAAVLNINGEIYYYVGDKNEGKYTINKEVGRVKKRMAPEVVPKENLVSNFLDEGTLIFSVKEESNIFLAETKDGGYEIFYKRK